MQPMKNLNNIGGVKKNRQNKYGLRRTHIKMDDTWLAGSVACYLQTLIDAPLGDEDFGLATKDIAQAHGAVLRNIVNYIRITEEHYHKEKL